MEKTKSQVEADLSRRKFRKTWWSCLFLLGPSLQIKGVFFCFKPILPYWRDETPFFPMFLVILLYVTLTWFPPWIVDSFLGFQGLLHCRKMCGMAVFWGSGRSWKGGCFCHLTDWVLVVIFIIITIIITLVNFSMKSSQISHFLSLKSKSHQLSLTSIGSFSPWHNLVKSWPVCSECWDSLQAYRCHHNADWRWRWVSSVWGYLKSFQNGLSPLMTWNLPRWSGGKGVIIEGVQIRICLWWWYILDPQWRNVCKTVVAHCTPPFG